MSMNHYLRDIGLLTSFMSKLYSVEQYWVIDILATKWTIGDDIYLLVLLLAEQRIFNCNKICLIIIEYDKMLLIISFQPNNRMCVHKQANKLSTLNNYIFLTTPVWYLVYELEKMCRFQVTLLLFDLV